MAFQMNTLTDEEHKERSIRLIDNFKNTKEDIDELYFLHNDRIRPRKLGRCSRCKTHVWQRLKQYYGKA